MLISFFNSYKRQQILSSKIKLQIMQCYAILVLSKLQYHNNGSKLYKHSKEKHKAPKRACIMIGEDLNGPCLGKPENFSPAFFLKFIPICSKVPFILKYHPCLLCGLTFSHKRLLLCQFDLKSS